MGHHGWDNHGWVGQKHNGWRKKVLPLSPVWVANFRGRLYNV